MLLDDKLIYKTISTSSFKKKTQYQYLDKGVRNTGSRNQKQLSDADIVQYYAKTPLTHNAIVIMIAHTFKIKYINLLIL